MAVVEVTAKVNIDAALSAAASRNPGLKFDPDSSKTFTDQTFYLMDDVFGTIHAFSNRGTYWTWSFASQAPKTIPTASDIAAIYTVAKQLAATRFGPIPFSAALNDKCPWINELTTGKTNLAIVDSITDGINSIDKNSVIKLIPPANVTVKNPDGNEVNFGIVYCMTTKFIAK